MIVELNKQKYHVCNDEFMTIQHEEYNYLIIKDKLGYYERIISLLCELIKMGFTDCILFNNTHGGFIPINCSNNFDNIFILKTEGIHQHNIYQNIIQHNKTNIFGESINNYKIL